MTVCVAALAAESKAIVCVADKATTYGPTISWDTDSVKIVPLNPASNLALISGNVSRNDLLVRAVQGIHLSRSVGELVPALTDIARGVSAEILDHFFLRPCLLTREDFVKAMTSPSANSEIVEIKNKMQLYNLDYHILVCGFTPDHSPYILDVSPTEVISDAARKGFKAIGSGASVAIARLVLTETKRSHSIDRVLFDAFSAKADAEISPGVGYEWDAKIILAGQPDVVDVPPEIKDVIERVWSRYNRSPFEWNKWDKDKDLKPEPKDWKQQLSAFCDPLLAKMTA